MSNDDFKREMLFQTIMHIARKMLSDGIISKKDYCEIDTIFAEKYKPVFGELFSDLSLTSKAERVIYSTEEA